MQVSTKPSVRTVENWNNFRRMLWLMRVMTHKVRVCGIRWKFWISVC